MYENILVLVVSGLITACYMELIEKSSQGVIHPTSEETV